MHSVLTTVALLGLTVSALPTENLEERTIITPPKTCRQRSGEIKLVNFDNLDTRANLFLGNIPVPYNGLTWEGFRYATPGAGTLLQPGIVADSPNNYAVTSPNLLGLGSNAAKITTYYPNAEANVKINLKSFRYGCLSTPLNSIAGVAIPCTVTVKAYNGGNQVSNSQLIATQTFAYNPTGAGSQRTALGNFDITKFLQSDFATIEYTIPRTVILGNLVSSLVIEDFRYEINRCLRY